MSLQEKGVSRSILCSTPIVATIVLGLVWISVEAGRAAENDGRKIYRARCSICHGTDGSGNTSQGKKLKATDLRSTKIRKRSDDLLLETIKSGYGNMPGFEKKLNSDQMQQVLEYVRELGGQDN